MSKIAGSDSEKSTAHKDFANEFAGWGDSEITSPELLIAHLFEALEGLVLARLDGESVVGTDGVTQPVYVTADGVDLKQIDVDSLRANVSIALQENVLFGISVRDNIRYVQPEASDAEVMAAAHVACADDYIASLPGGLDTVLGDRGGRLSTGQRQRLSIARAVVRNASILILDEPTAALDAETEQRVLTRLGEWGRGKAIFLITHRISTIQQADQIIYMDQGEILERGTHAELMALDGGRYRSFVETDAGLVQGGTT